MHDIRTICASSMATHLHKCTVLAYSCAPLLHSCTTPATSSTCIYDTFHTYKLADTVNLLGECAHSGAPHTCPEKHYTTQISSSNVKGESACPHRRPACTTSHSPRLVFPTLTTEEQGDQGVTTTHTNVTFSDAKHCCLPTLTMWRSGESLPNASPATHTHTHTQHRSGQGLHGSTTGDRLSCWAGWPSMHECTLAYGSPSLTSSALAYPPMLGLRQMMYMDSHTHVYTRMHTSPECPGHCWASTGTLPTSATDSMLLHSVSPTVSPSLQGAEMLSHPLSTWWATSSSALLP